MHSDGGSEADAISLCAQKQRGRYHFIVCSDRGNEADAISLCGELQPPGGRGVACNSQLFQEGKWGVHCDSSHSCFRWGSGVFIVILLSCFRWGSGVLAD